MARKSIDITGNKYGRLTPVCLSDVVPNKNGRLVEKWKFLCECGNYHITWKTSVMQGDTKSCGCRQYDRSRRLKLNLKDQVFGRWKVIDITPKTSQYSDVYWLCRCECGVEREVRSYALVSGHSRSCGCYNREISRSMCGENSVHWKDVVADHECPICGGIFKQSVNASKGKVFCSKECTRISRQSKRGALSPTWNGGPVKTPCSTCGKDLWRQPSQLARNENAFCDNHCLGKWLSKHQAGISHYNYNPDLDRQGVYCLRRSDQYKEWRSVVFKRDGYTCQCCGGDSNSLHAHHILGVKELFQTRMQPMIFDPDNGVTLCKSCHLRFHSLHGRHGNNEDQLWDYIASSPYA